jgi:hypothetical protein
MVGAAERHRILVADFAAQGPRLHEAQVMRLGGLPLAAKTRLRRHELQMGAIAVAARLAQRHVLAGPRPASASIRRERRFVGGAEACAGT